jgi:hypothetical protein
MRTSLVVAAVVGALVAPASAGALTVGIGDQQPPAFADGRLRALGLRVARLTVPWDAAATEPAAVQAWLDAVAAAGMTPHVAFEHRRSDRCPGSPCVVPSRSEYRAAVAAFHARFPQVRTFTTWNEANHQSQPVASRPEAVAGFYEELVSVCPSCTVVAGDVLDSGSYVRWLQRFRAATALHPRLWGLHNYGDTTYGTTSGTDAVLAAVPGKLWIEETGGIVTLRNAAGRSTLAPDETRAATAIDRAFAIARARPRVTRMYVYQWRASALDRFDSGLVRPDGSLRPSYPRVVRDLAAMATVSWSAPWSSVRPRRIVLRAMCPAVLARCQGKVAVSRRTRAVRAGAAQLRRLTIRSYRTTAARRTVSLRVDVSRALWRRLRSAASRRLVLTVRPGVPAGKAARISLALARPSS